STFYTPDRWVAVMHPNVVCQLPNQTKKRKLSKIERKKERKKERKRKERSCRMDVSSRLEVWQQLAESCGLSTVQQGLQQVWRLLLLCLICRLCFRLGEQHCVWISTQQSSGGLLFN
ncbi:protein-serine O-palmitoleoyltransferase porcupine-like isoform X1, partial [Scomber scombrus]